MDRPSQLTTRRFVLAAWGVVVLVAVGFGVLWAGPFGPARSATDLPPGTGVVTEVIDGDTVVVRLSTGEEHVRLIGIDTPETVHPERPPECFGAEASARTKALLPPGTVVRLERDAEPRDHFGRLLAYVVRQRDGLLVNRVLLEEGLARVLSIAPNRARQAELAAAAAAAERAGAGLWSACPRAPPG
jgi:micrococcal nuclease